ncbi:uncharacterized protein BBOV_IV001515 [Babesia bovis T2Bo]|uniref:uncharacterized protein n=1 Tax=Babesia bovis T2Bo TaxID=484906 RepID=UPI001DFBE891|nr:uncharacterized protein BBOV_IV001515 [Babesia bovis T2Bo]KAG6439922.1 hypothetical protein BBOV_IV001515 [Babesia bovis T2Bo]
MHKSVYLVLFRDNRAIVVYNNVVGIRAISLPTENELPPVGHRSVCSLCGNDIDDGQ